MLTYSITYINLRHLKQLVAQPSNWITLQHTHPQQQHQQPQTSPAFSNQHFIEHLQQNIKH